MNSLAASWWERVTRALKPLTESLSRLSSPRPKPVKVPVRTEPARRTVKSSAWVPSALLAVFAASCGGPNDPTPPGSTDPGASDPEVTSISPSSGPADGGTLVTITGVGFDSSELTEVLFGSNNATGVLATSETTIVCNAPAGVGGASVDVVVVMTSGSLAAPTQFTYEAPPNAELEITWRNSSGGISTGVLTVELFNETPITSQNFRDLAEQGLYDDTLFHRVRFRDKLEGGDFENGNGTGGRAASYQGIGDEADSSTWRIPDEAGSSPDHQPGALAMHLPAGPDSAGSVFYIACPNSDLSNRDGVNTVFAQATGGTIDGVDVGFEAILESLHRVATGSGNVPTQPVRLVEVRLSGGSISDPGDGDGDGDGDGGADDGSNGDDDLAPTLTQVEPSFGPPLGGHQVVLSGSGFAINTETPPIVRFNGEDASSVVVTSDGSLFCLTPPGPASTSVDVEVLTQAGTATVDGAYEYLAGPVVLLDVVWTDALGEPHSGRIATELYDSAAPIHVENFLLHTSQGSYDGVPIHRIIDLFMIQGGDFENGNGTGGYAAAYYGFGDPNVPSSWTVPDEADNGLVHVPGALSMAKTSAPNSGGSQFFFVDRDSVPSHLNGVHTVFGSAVYGVYDGSEVSGIDVVDFISQVETGSNDQPLFPVTIELAMEVGGGPIGFMEGGGIASWQPWNYHALHESLLSQEGKREREGSQFCSGTRGVYCLKAEKGDVVKLSVRSLEAGESARPPFVFGRSSGDISLTEVATSVGGVSCDYSVKLERSDELLVFVPVDPAVWVKLWVDSAEAR